MSKRKIATIWGFPVGWQGDESTPTVANARGPMGRRGVALLLAIMIIATMMIFTADMIVTSSVNLKLSTKHRDNAKAEYLAKSGLNLSLFLIAADYGIDLFQYQAQNTPPTDGPGDIWGMLNGMPIGGETMEMMGQMSEEFELSKVNDSAVLDQLKLFDGSFAIIVEDESRKINVNYCMEGQSFECLAMLEALMSCPAEKEFLARKKITPREIAANIKDWVDPNTTGVEGWSASANEEAPYDKRDPKVVPKNAPFDSLDELKLVAGWDEEMHKVFSPFLTIYPIPPQGIQAKPKINLNTASREMLSCLLPESAGTCAEIAAKFTSPVEKEDMPPDVANPADVQRRLAEVFCESDQSKSKWFSYRTDVFKVQATGDVDGNAVTIEAVIKRGMPDAQDKKDGFTGSYKLLSWKML